MRTIKCPPGIGDSIWLFQKLIHSGEKFHFQLHNGFPQRGKQVFDLLPQLSSSCTYVPNLPYAKIDYFNAVNRYKYWNQIRMNDIFLSANRHLEEGRRIELFLPDLPTAYTLKYATVEPDTWKAFGVLKEGKKHIGIYGSAYSTQRAWNFWDADGWYKFIDLMRKENQNLVFVIIGASFDVDLAGDLIARLENGSVKYVNTIGQPLSVVVEILKQLDYFVGFPSGLSILNETLGAKGTLMFYPQHLSKMINAWADPARIESGQYKGCLFCEPEHAFQWLRDEYKLFDKL